MHEVFISKSTKDDKQAQCVVEYLEKSGISCWVAPRNIALGTDYDAEITKAVESCKVFIVLISNYSMSSKEVENELRIAVNYQKLVIPFMLENLPLTGAFMYHIRGKHRCDAYAGMDNALWELLSHVLNAIGIYDTSASREGFQIDEAVEIQKTTPTFYYKCPQCSCTRLSCGPTTIQFTLIIFTTIVYIALTIIGVLASIGNFILMPDWLSSVLEPLMSEEELLAKFLLLPILLTVPAFLMDIIERVTGKTQSKYRCGCCGTEFIVTHSIGVKGVENVEFIIDT